ncbi:HD domain-containing phosphohydrolase [Paenibacillus solisilvae]|uniref:HD domain-containing phosphohydrolase n=1 Tax=Paenibacillus solisilvae TaxID=2486751 RepID=A0ABW0VZ98_9BACL
MTLQHHEREDGSGYPLGISGEKITPFSKIFAIFQEIYQRAFGLFDPMIVQCLSPMMNRLIGSVLMSDGQVARIHWFSSTFMNG